MSAAPKVKDTVKFDLEIVAGPHTGTKLNFSKPSVTIGRGPENDVVLSGDPRVSRQHAEIKARGPGEFVVVNLSSKNFILLNGQTVQTEILTNGSVVQIGDTEILFKAEAPKVIPDPVPSPLQVVTPVYKAPVTAPPPIPQQVVNHQVPNSHGGFATHEQKPLPPRKDNLLQNPKARFYGIIAILVIAGWFLFSSGTKSSKDPNAIRTSSISMKDVADAEKRTQELLTVQKEKYDSVQYRRAQENFIKGFRDFQQGQYARARESFQVVLNLDPDNELAKRYFHLSKIKFDELVKFNMMQGNRYREKKNWRMCQSNYSNVMTMLQYRKDDPSYKEAKQFFEECTLNLEGRF
ncbi:MAG: FHA domain-containing protein [Bdellovibrio sp.]